MSFIGRNGSYFTRGMFWEFKDDVSSSDEDSDAPRIFTTKEFDITKDGVVRKSFIRLFVETNDPTGYTFSQNYLGGFKHWEELCKCSWFKPILEKALSEIELKHKAMAIANIYQEALTGKNKLQASKTLLEMGYVENDNGRKGKVGRPSKEKIKQEAQKLLQDSKDIDEDYKRILQ